MRKRILGLDLGTTSIGWAFVVESDDPEIPSSIKRLGVRVNPLTTDEQINFGKGKKITINSDRTLKRGARRTLQRYKQRRSNLIDILIKNNIITSETIISENEKNSTHSTYAIRSKAAEEEISKIQFAQVLLMINKKRGYRSCRKAKKEDEGQAIDSMEIAKRLYEEYLTPGELSYRLLQEGKKSLPDYYRSDLNKEMNSIWSFQKQFYPEILTNEFRSIIEGKGQKATAASFWGKYQFNTVEIKGSREEKKLITYKLRSKAIDEQLTKEEVAHVIAEINGNIYNSSGYLGAISDRSKELYFNKLTVGQYLYAQIQKNPHARLKNQVFYRQDYLDEFEKIWQIQSEFHRELTQKLKAEIRDIIIFYQRKLKSQKKLLSFCQFESKSITIPINNTFKTKTIGYKVSPKSSPLFQEFKIWQNLGNLLIQNKKSKETNFLDYATKQILFDELNIKGNHSKDEVLSILGYDSKEWDLNFKTLEGNRSNQELYKAYFTMMGAEEEGMNLSSMAAADIKENVTAFFEKSGIETSILHFDAELDGKKFEQQSAYELWHLLYSYEGDQSASGNEKLHQLLQKKFSFTLSQAKILANINLPNNHGSLSAKAMKKIFPFIKELRYNLACAEAGYNHSSSLTKEENEKRTLKDKLELLPKNSLRNPVVEKILNQMINVINSIIDDPDLGKPDEIRIELARELKKNAEERTEMTLAINKATSDHEKIRGILIKEDGILNPTRNDVIRYKLYQELRNNGYKTLYSNTYIPREKLFSKEYDIEHIIPKALLFDDSFSNKTLCVRQENIDKGHKTASEFIGSYFGEDKIQDYLERVEMLFQLNQKNAGEGINKAKYKKLLMKASEIGEGFIERDLRDSQYIAKKAKSMLMEICKTVVSTTGSITDRLREDWGLVNIMQELNFEKYKKQGLTEFIKKKDGSYKERIIDWSKRNDHRHHAVDALTVAFTQHNHIQYLNNLNAKSNELNKKQASIISIENKITELIIDDEGTKKRKFKKPMPAFRTESLKHLERILISCKTKNKIATKNKNKFKAGGREKTKIELTPRSQLHKETIYGKIKQYSIREEKIGSKLNEEIISKVSKSAERVALQERLKAFNNDPKKAFTDKNSLDNNPIFLDKEKKIKLAEKIKIVSFENDYTIRKDLHPDNFKDLKSIDKVIDVGIRNILKNRLEEYNGNVKEAFSNLDKNPIWLNEEKGINIKRVTIRGVTNVEALHFKRNHLGKYIFDNNGNMIPTDFVSTGNNHHVAIYKDINEDLQENVVSFYEAMERVNQGLPIIDKGYNQDKGWKFLFTIKQNEYFIFPSEDFDPSEIDLMNENNYKLISPYLFRVQKIASKNYFFRHHLETKVEEPKALKGITYKSQLGLAGIAGIIKVRINHIGKIVKVGEY